MIVFVLDGPREKATGAELQWFTLFIGGVDFDGFGAGDVGVDFRETQATFGAELIVAEQLQYWIDEDERHVQGRVHGLAIDFHDGGPVLDFANIDDGKLEGVADLLGGETDTGGIFHRFQHVGDKLADFLGQFTDRRAFAAEDGIAVFNDGQQHRATGAATHHSLGQARSWATSCGIAGLWAVRT